MVARVLDFEEGFSAVPYLCSEGYVTIGLGTKLHSQKGLNPADFTLTVTREIAYLMLEREVAHVRNRIRAGRNGATFNVQPLAVQHILLSMAYQMGYSGVSAFKKMWKALEDNDYDEASRQALDSRWARQTPERANRHAEVLRVRNMSPYSGLIEGVL